MAYTAVPTKSPGDTWTAAEHNQYVRDNFAASVPDIFTAKGSLVVATAADVGAEFPVSSTDGQVLAANSSRTSGIEWVNSDRLTIDAKGDLLVGSAADTLARLPVGTNGYVLISDSGATYGVKWAIDPVQDLAQAKGDLLVGSAADTLGRLAVSSTDGYILYVDIAESLGVKWAASPQQTIDAKGDLLAGSAADTLVRVAVGTGGTVLTADSSRTSGLAWGAGPAAAYARYYKSSATSIANNSLTILNYDTEDYDTVSGVTTGAAWKFTANSTTAGYYLVTAMASFRATSVWGVNEQAGLFLYKNNAQYQVLSRLFMHAAGDYRVSVNGAGVVNLADTDYIDIRVYQNSGNALSIQSTGTISHVALARVF